MAAATIEVTRRHTLGAEAGRAKAEQVAKSMADSLGLTWSWKDEQTVTFACPRGLAKGTTGRLEITEATLRLVIELPFLLAAMKSRVQKSVDEELDALGLNDHSPPVA